MKLKKLFGGLLVFALVVSSAAVTPVKAADVTELAGLMGQYQVSTDGGEYNCTTQLWASNDVEISDPTKLTMSCDVYVPLASYEQIAGTDGGININPEIHIFTYDRETEVYNGYNISMMRVDTDMDADGNLNYWYHNNKTEEDTDKPEYASMEQIGDFVRISLKDTTVDNGSSSWHSYHSSDENKDEETEIGQIPGGTYNTDVNMSVNGWNFNGSGKFLFTNVEMKYDGTTIFTGEYSTSEPIATLIVDANGTHEDKEITATAMNTTFGTSKAKVSVKAKKSTKVDVTTHFSDDKVTVKTSKKKVATASYKNGKVVIKGKKKGSAVITVTSDGISKDIKVTVKK